MHQSPKGFPAASPAYIAAQSAMAPQERPLQIEQSMAELQGCVEILAETLRALVRRLEPVAGELDSDTRWDEPQKVATKVPLAEQIDRCCRIVNLLTTETQQAIGALQL